MVYKFVILSIGLCMLMLSPRQLPAQELSKPVELNPSEIQWVWGEVVSVNGAEKSMTVKYLDYDTDEEKTIIIMITDATTYQEIKGLEGIKAADTVSVEYTSNGGKNIAKDITVEKIEDADAGADAVQAMAPEKVGAGPVTETEGPAQTVNR